jgi:proline iminopeptidase
VTAFGWQPFADAPGGFNPEPEMLEPTSARPAFTRIVKGLRAIAGSGGIDETLSVAIGGVKQRLDIRARDVECPILLFVHGGPGSPESPTSWLYQGAWEEFFVVVQWDQRGCGRSLVQEPGQADLDAITIERMIDDGEEVVDYLLKRFGRRKLFLVGHSWGTVIGVELAQRCPGKLLAYVGIGQVVDSIENESVSYAFAIRRAEETENSDALRELAAIAPYPPSGETFSVPDILTERKWVNHFGGMFHERRDATHLDQAKTLSPDYSDEDLARAGLATASILRLLPQLLSFSVKAVTRLACPVFIFAGRFDHATPSQVAQAWFDKLEAPAKKLVWFERSAHMVQYEEPGKVLLTLVNEILPLA